MAKIKVFYVGEYSVKFDMDENDLLPEEGEYHLVKVGSENDFINKYLADIQFQNKNKEQAMKLLLAKLERVDNELKKE